MSAWASSPASSALSMLTNRRWGMTCFTAASRDSGTMKASVTLCPESGLT